MWLKSDAFGGGGAIPRRYTCDGENLSPPLAWGDVPAGARSLVILCEDPDGPSGMFRHWAAYDIPIRLHGFKEGVVEASGVPQALNDFRRVGYGGPCPRMATGRIDTCSGCWRSPATNWACRLTLPAAPWNAPRGETCWPKPFSSGPTAAEAGGRGC